MDVEAIAGKIAIGRPANLLITKPISSLAFLPYHFGETGIEKVLLNGQVL
jgi:imidazolonepropionase